jgi:Domain of unknown function (DUF1844)
LTEPKHEDTFKVVDRRLFNETGEMRKDVAEQTEREQNAADAIAAKTRAAQAAAAPAATKTVEANDGEAQIMPSGSAAAPVANSANDKPANRSFQMLVDFIARNAAMLLGGYTDPRTGQPLLDLDGAREVIDMLDALRETTHGNLGAEDDKLLLDVIGSLKLSFMEISKAAAAAALKEKTKTHP